MGLTTAAITADIEHIFEDLADTSIIESSVSVLQGDDVSTERGTVDVLRGEQLTAEELEASGLQETYQFTVRAFRSAADAAGLVKGDVLDLADGQVRVLRIRQGGARVLLWLDCGDVWE